MDDIGLAPMIKIIPTEYEPKNIRKNQYDLTETLIDFHDMEVFSQTALEVAGTFIANGCVPTKYYAVANASSQFRDAVTSGYSRLNVELEIDTNKYEDVCLNDIVFCGSIAPNDLVHVSANNPRILIIYLHTGRLIEFRYEGDYCGGQYVTDRDEKWRYVVYKTADEYINTNVEGADIYTHDNSGTWRKRLSRMMGVDLILESGWREHVIPILEHICDEVYVYCGKLRPIVVDRDANKLNSSMVAYPVSSEMISSPHELIGGSATKILDYRLASVVSVITSFMTLEELCVFYTSIPSYDRASIRAVLKESMKREDIILTHFGPRKTTFIPKPEGYIQIYAVGTSYYVILCEKKTLILKHGQLSMTCIGPIVIDPFATIQRAYTADEVSEWKRIVDTHKVATQVDRRYHETAYEVYRSVWDGEENMYVYQFPEGVFAVNGQYLEIMSGKNAWIYKIDDESDYEKRREW